MTLTACPTHLDALAAVDVKNTPWQARLKAAGLSQKRLAALLDLSENTVSRQMKGEWDVPGYVEAFVTAWEECPPEVRNEIAKRLAKA